MNNRRRSRRLYRSRTQRNIAGVAGGIARYFGIDVVIVRLLFILGTLLTSLGTGISIYIVLWLLMPDEYDQPAYVVYQV